MGSGCRRTYCKRRECTLGHFRLALRFSRRPGTLVSSDKLARRQADARVVEVDIICHEITQLARQLCGPTDLTN